MNNNTLVGLIIAAVVILGGIAVFMYGPQDTAPTTTNNTVVLPGESGGDAGSTSNTYSSTTTTTTTTSVTTPVPTSKAATDVTSSVATLHGTVTANGAPTTYWFEYSSDPLLGSVLNRTTAKVVIAAAAKDAPVFASVSGLSSSTKYYYRLVTENSAGLVRGERVSFSTI